MFQISNFTEDYRVKSKIPPFCFLPERQALLVQAKSVAVNNSSDKSSNVKSMADSSNRKRRLTGEKQQEGRRDFRCFLLRRSLNSIVYSSLSFGHQKSEGCDLQSRSNGD
jgi:hypothetical protein